MTNWHPREELQRLDRWPSGDGTHPPRPVGTAIVLTKGGPPEPEVVEWLYETFDDVIANLIENSLTHALLAHGVTARSANQPREFGLLVAGMLSKIADLVESPGGLRP